MPRKPIRPMISPIRALLPSAGVRTSKHQLQSELNNARIGGRSDSSEGRSAEGEADRTGAAEIGSVGGVKDLRPELKPHALPQLETLEHGKIEIHQAGSANHINTLVAEEISSRDLRVGRDGKSRRSDPVVGLARCVCRIADEIGATNGIGFAEGVGKSWRERQTALKRRDSIQLPSS